MKYTNQISEYIIDLELPEYRRWQDVIKKEKKIAKRLCKDAIADIDAVGPSPLIRKFMSSILKNTYCYGGGLYTEEMQSWSDALNMSLSDIVLVNCTYELSHLENISIFGCTAGIKYVPNLGMVHVRNMDWPIASIGPATRIFRFKKKSREFISVGLPGKVSVISGMLPGKYSVTINWAPSNFRPSFDFGPSFLLRDVLESCDSYDEAVSYLSGTSLSSHVFYTVCGSKKGEGCIIERTKSSYNIREWTGGVLTQANHFEGKFKSHNHSLNLLEEDDDPDTETAYEDSVNRAETLKESLAIKKVTKISDLRKALNISPVQNEESHQQMIFIPNKGEYKIWASRPK